MDNKGNRLLALVERIERLEEERKAIASDIKDVYGEGKAAGVDIKAMRQLVKERAEDPATREEFEAMMEVYRAAIGALRGTPLGAAARRRLMRSAPPPDQAPAAPGKPANGQPDEPPPAEPAKEKAA